jgi:hypothetical protein
MQTPPYGYDQLAYTQLPPPPALLREERARRLVALVDQKLLPRFAPYVDRLAVGSDRGPILRAPPPPGWVPLRLDTRRALAFDGELTAWLIFAVVVVIVVWAHAVAAITEFVSHDKWWLYVLAVVAGVVALAVTIGMLVASARRTAARICVLRAVLARSVVVPARIGAATLMRTHGVLLAITVTVDYEYAGAWRRGFTCMRDRAAYALLGPTPEILVDTQRPDNVLFKDIYV